MLVLVCTAGHACACLKRYQFFIERSFKIGECHNLRNFVEKSKKFGALIAKTIGRKFTKLTYQNKIEPI